MEIPKLSVAKISLLIEKPSREDFESFGKELYESFSKVGFAYILDHGVDKKLIKSAMAASRDFFKLDREIKEAIPRHPDVQQGYVAPGREIFDQKEDGTKGSF